MLAKLALTFLLPLSQAMEGFGGYFQGYMDSYRMCCWHI